MLSTRNEIACFVRDYARAVRDGRAALFLGAGMSRSSGYVDWRELLREIAEDLGLRIDQEHDLISVAQFHVNKNGPNKVSREILRHFADRAVPSEAHRTLARMPIGTYWTTNYDALIETALRDANKVPDVKKAIADLNVPMPKRHAVVYKMHGDASSPASAVLYKEQYEKYQENWGEFVTALKGDLVSKSFLFLGFSFTDPNLDYILSRLRTSSIGDHTCIMKLEAGSAGDPPELVEYKRRRQALHIADLKRFRINTLLVHDYGDIPLILKQIEDRYLSNTVFVSGSAENYGEWSRDDAQTMLHRLSAELVRADFRVINGFGWGVGGAVINGALEAIYGAPEKYGDDRLVLRPFPQEASGGVDLPALWDRYRNNMLDMAGAAIFVFGNKFERTSGEVVPAIGVRKEFEMAVAKGRIPFPIGATGSMAAELTDLVLASPEQYLGRAQWLVDDLRWLASRERTANEIVARTVDALGRLRERLWD